MEMITTWDLVLAALLLSWYRNREDGGAGYTVRTGTSLYQIPTYKLSKLDEAHIFPSQVQ